MLSVSDLSSAEFCKRKLFLTKRCGLKEVPKDAAIRGKVIHALYEQINNSEERIVSHIFTEDPGEIRNTYKKEYDRIINAILAEKRFAIDKTETKVDTIKEDVKKNIDREIKIRSDTVINTIGKHRVFGEDLWTHLTPKITSERMITSERLQLRGVVDAIQEFDNAIVPVEMKTGQAPNEGIWPNHRLQLAAYMTILKDISGKKIRKGILKYVDEDVEQGLAMNQFFEEDIKKKIDEVKNILNGPLPEQTDNKNKCKSCNLKDICYNQDKIDSIISICLKKP